ncbi:lipopolysaccharide transport periplasmic protein LptA [Azovibrio restrictus]|uniref:lipopolysaccharide transport periplasmic protein LptA n=1 Tax=Azovibrio restrictus TaxID=146938 RepID=UPI0026F247A7|nr:lipopolysaccharide transport periplasmic protein LptA [Azovibrio restrictus]
MTNRLPALLLLLGLSLGAGVAQAERADREKPITLEADKVTIDDIKRVQILEGNVILTQGTLMIQSDKIVVTEDPYGFQRGTAFGGPGGLARFRQKREASEDWIEGEAERIEYDTRTEVAELFHRAWVKSGEDQLKGEYIWYDAISERYLASAGESSLKKPSRVRAIIQPKNKNAPPATATQRPAGIQLRTADGLMLPARE